MSSPSVWSVCIAASQSSGHRRQVLEKIRAKREMMIKLEDPDELSEHNDEDNRNASDSIGSQPNLCSAISPANVKSLLTEYVLQYYLAAYFICGFVVKWLVAGMVICLGRGAGLHMAQLMPLPLAVSCFSKIQIGTSSSG